MKNFLFSDVHGCYDGLIGALDKAGYDPENPNHQLYSGGDDFGRSDFSKDNSGSLKIYKFLTSKEHKNKPKIVFSNHHDILLQMLDSEFLSYTDVYNGEHKTLGSFAGLTGDEVIMFGPEVAFERTKKLGIRRWLKTLPFFYDIEGGYRLVHGWMPNENGVILKDLEIDRERWIESTWCHTEDEIWRFCEAYPNGWEKTLVFGHWHTCQLHLLTEGEDKGNYDIWQDKRHKLIGLDPCSYVSRKVNVLVIENGKVTNPELQ